MWEEKFSERFTWAREAAGLSQSEVARRVVPKIAPQSVQQWEGGVTVPRANRMRELARVLGVRERWLAFGELPVREGDADPAPGGRVGADPTPDDWRSAVTARLPDRLRRYANREPLPGFPLMYASPSTLADVTSGDLVTAQAALWRLLTLARLLSATSPELQAILYLPSGAPLSQLQWEAHPAGLRVQLAGDPGTVAAELTARDG